MFTGIVETTGKVEKIEKSGTNYTFTIESAISAELKIDQSVSHNGVCLTVVGVDGGAHQVTAIHETMEKTSLGLLGEGDLVNLERCMLANGRFDGHIVQGHVDQVGVCISRTEEDGSWLFDFKYDDALGNVTVEKGSICVNGVSLTCFNSRKGEFRVAIIPYTFEHTNFKNISKGTNVNLEFDILGKYIQRILKGY
ncbi:MULTISPECIES: riboflavin synthase [unclassified Imperialibacter]|uniref:riboflavin synthase n=2 Tax=Imperialibacter TaxID=1649461 RepID=UPI0012524675|nr:MULTISPECIES: riboflavin synthase [unclassified Imperialibacter]CAD5279642.1 Riboflavin synthase [Imperialibacter sp. 75]CAD5288614.1 Riboflavin synthase [Imperialibacter sp. 89]VVT16044.1 Riboflavin synthase [Imperialibacter sp. EC-SDR9]